MATGLSEVLFSLVAISVPVSFRASYVVAPFLADDSDLEVAEIEVRSRSG